MSYRIYSTDFSTISNESQTDKAIVLDIDECMVHTFDDDVDDEHIEKLGIFTKPELEDLRKRIYKLELDDVSSKKGEGHYMEMWGIIRPHIKDFLLFCFSYFRIVGVWSAGLPRYVENIVDFLFKDLPKPHIVFTRDECHKNTTLCEKPLMKIIDANEFLRSRMSLENTFIVDDQKKSFINNNKDNGVLIPGYQPGTDVDSMRTNDIALQQLKMWFSTPEVRNSEDVRTLDKKKIFKKSLKSYEKSA